MDFLTSMNGDWFVDASWHSNSNAHTTGLHADTIQKQLTQKGLCEPRVNHKAIYQYLSVSFDSHFRTRQ